MSTDHPHRRHSDHPHTTVGTIPADVAPVDPSAPTAAPAMTTVVTESGTVIRGPAHTAAPVVDDAPSAPAVDQAAIVAAANLG